MKTPATRFSISWAAACCFVVIFLLISCRGASAEKGDEQDEVNLRLVVDRSERKLLVYLGDHLLRKYDVAVGQADHPTPTGNWKIDQVDMNPYWTPPDSEWAADEEYKPPGHPDNPMGRARLVFRAPYTIHGTDGLDSLGEAASHGSVRVANEVVIELARLVLQEGGAWRGGEWYQEIFDTPTEMESISLEKPIPIEVRE